MVEKSEKLTVAHFISDSGHRERQALYEFYAMAIKDKTISEFYILNGNKDFITFLLNKNQKVIELNYTPKSIFDIIRKAWQLKSKLIGVNIVHCHYHEANVLGLLTALFARVPVRIITRHHNAFKIDNYGLIEVFKKRVINLAANVFIAPCKSVQNTLVQEAGIPEKKIKLIPHPFDINIAGKPTETSISKIRQKHLITKDSLTIGVISSFQKIKGTKLILEVFNEIKDDFKNITLVLANANGPELDEMFALAGKDERIKFISYETDVLSLYKTFDIFVHIPISEKIEAFGQVYIEALKLGVPSIFTKSGIGSEVLFHNYNCVLIEYENSNQLKLAMKELILNEKKRKVLSENAITSVNQKYTLQEYSEKIMAVYNQQFSR